MLIFLEISFLLLLWRVILHFLIGFLRSCALYVLVLLAAPVNWQVRSEKNHSSEWLFFDDEEGGEIFLHVKIFE